MKKNYWPVAIVGIILFGMVIISIGVMIAVKNPVVDEEMYGGKKRDVDEFINVILQEQRDFESRAKVILHIGEQELELQTPYLIHAPKKSSKPPVFVTPLYVYVNTESQDSITIDSVNLVVTSFMKDVADSTYKLLHNNAGSIDKAIYILQEPIAFAKDGRYKLKFRIDFTENNPKERESLNKSAYFEQEVFYSKNTINSSMQDN